MRELLALRRGARLPVRPQTASGDLCEIEDLVGDGANRVAPFPGLCLLLELRVGQGGADREQPQREGEQAGVEDPVTRHQRSRICDWSTLSGLPHQLSLRA